MNFDAVEQSNDEDVTSLMKIIILEFPDIHYSNQFETIIPYNSERRELDLGHCLHHLLQQIFPYSKQMQVFYYCPHQKFYSFAGVFPFKQSLYIGEQFVTAKQISVRVRQQASQEQIIQQKEVQKQRKRRFNERTIRGALQKISEWRQIHQKNSKMSLEDAAKIVGISKNTLDDYYSQIKLASHYGFDFKSNLNQKIGVLRKFVKQNHIKKEEIQQSQFLDAILKKENSDSGSEEE